jgi:hypothetical protein
MKKHLSIVLFGIATISLTGCYTQVVVEENDDSYVYQEPVPVIIYYPVPEPILVPGPPPHPPIKPIKPEYKIRKPDKTVTPPPKNERIRDDIRNSGGRNDGGRKSRR